MAFKKLRKLGVHPAYKMLYDEYNRYPRSRLKPLRTVLSCLAHLDPRFQYIEYLPSMLYSFLDVCCNESTLVFFEISLTFLNNWCNGWFSTFHLQQQKQPHFDPQKESMPPTWLIAKAVNILKIVDRDLYNHFKTLNVSPVIYIWNPIKSLFSTFFYAEEWYQVWDNLVRIFVYLFICKIVMLMTIYNFN